MPITAEPVYGTVTVAGDEHRIVLGGSTPGQSESPHGLTYDIDRFNTAAELEVSILADDTPPEDATVSCSIQSETIFTGEVTEAQSRTGHVHLIANDIALDLKRSTLTQTFEQATIAEIARAALDKAGAEYSINLPNETTSAEYTGKRCDKILEDVADWGRAVWVVDETNTVQLTQDVAGLSTTHALDQIIDAAPGERSMPYQSVQVEGSSPTSRRGRPSMHMISSGALTAEAGEGEPTYRHQDDRIKTQAMAENAAQAILDELKRQRATGPIKAVGDPSVRPYDTITLPEHIDTGEYLVTGLQHRITSRDGFRSTVQCGGIVS